MCIGPKFRGICETRNLMRALSPKRSHRRRKCIETEKNNHESDEYVNGRRQDRLVCQCKMKEKMFNQEQSCFVLWGENFVSNACADGDYDDDDARCKMHAMSI